LNYRHKWQVTHDVSAKMNELASTNWLLSSRRQRVDACRTSVPAADPEGVRWVRTNPPPAGCGGWKRYNCMVVSK